MNKRAWLPVSAVALALSLSTACTQGATNIAAVSPATSATTSSPATSPAPIQRLPEADRANRDFQRRQLESYAAAARQVEADRIAKAALAKKVLAKKRAHAEHVAAVRAAAARHAAQVRDARKRHEAEVRERRRAAIAAAARKHRAVSTPVVTSPHLSLSAIQHYAFEKVGAGQYSCLDYVVTHESHWNPNDQNSHSTAYGLFQFLDSTWADTGISKTSDPYRQVDAGVIYMKNRYGSPCGAAAYWRSHQMY